MCHRCRTTMLAALPILLTAGAAAIAAEVRDDAPDAAKKAHGETADAIALGGALCAALNANENAEKAHLEVLADVLGPLDSKAIVRGAKAAHYLGDIAGSLASAFAAAIEERAVKTGDPECAEFLLRGVGRDVREKAGEFLRRMHRERAAGMVAVDLSSLFDGSAPAETPKYEH